VISVCMMTKDDGRTIRQALESALVLGDEVILMVDDKSTDDTLEIAKEYEKWHYKKVKLSTYTFEYFGAARNRMIKLASKDWIFMLDGDEVVDAPDCEALRAMIATNPPPAVYLMPRNNWKDMERKEKMEGNQFYPDWQTRLYPGHEKVLYRQQKVHEAPAGVPWQRMSNGIHLQHWAFALRTHEDWQKIAKLYKSLEGQG